MRLHRSIAEIGRTAWETCFPGEVEGFGYHSALERAGIEGFSFGWVAAWRGERLVCAAPCFTTRYDLVTTAQGRLRRFLEAVRKAVPGQLAIRVSCLGSPEVETCQIGFAPELDEAERQTVLAELVAFWQRQGAAEGISLFGIKDVDAADHRRYGAIFDRDGFFGVPSLPGAVLPIDFASLDAYLMQLSARTRKDMRRKLRGRDRITIETPSEPLAAIPQVFRLYEETRARAEWAFETFDEGYFREVVRQGEGARIVLYRQGERILGANLLIETPETLLDKFFVMDGAEGRALDLYFHSWMENIAHCARRGIREYVAGAASYETKLRLGCRLQRRWIYFRHSRRAAHLLLRAATPFLGIDQPAPPGPAWEAE